MILGITNVSFSWSYRCCISPIEYLNVVLCFGELLSQVAVKFDRKPEDWWFGFRNHVVDQFSVVLTTQVAEIIRLILYIYLGLSILNWFLDRMDCFGYRFLDSLS